MAQDDWVNVRMPRELAAKVQDYVDKGGEGFTSRADVVAAAVRAYLKGAIPHDSEAKRILGVGTDFEKRVSEILREKLPTVLDDDPKAAAAAATLFMQRAVGNRTALDELIDRLVDEAVHRIFKHVAATDPKTVDALLRAVLAETDPRDGPSQVRGAPRPDGKKKR